MSPGPVPTLDDVARHAGVHPATVSRTLSRPEVVKGDTLARVRAAIDAVGYVPNRAARQLAGGRTSRLAVLVPDITNPYFAEMVDEIQSTAGTADELVLVAGTALRASEEVAAVRSVVGNVDGIIVCSPTATAGALMDAAVGTPVVSVNRRSRSLSSVVLDQEAVVDLAVEHLRSLGHRRIAVLLGPASYWSTERRRRAAERLAVATVGSVDPTFEGGGSALGAVVAGGFTAVAAFNDVMAFGLIAAAIERDIAVPGRLSVVGSDDIAFAAMHRPALTTVDGRARAVGRAALELLHELLAAGGTTVDVRTVAPTLVVRSSTAPTEKAETAEPSESGTPSPTETTSTVTP